nr:protein kish-A isoform X3 [Equus caballus]
MAGGSEEAGGACTPLPPWARKGDVAGASPASLWLLGIFWKCARIDKRYKFMNSATELNEEALKMTMTLKIFIGERKSPYVAICCIVMAFSILFIQ